MKPFEWNPGTLLEMSGHYWKTCTLHAGVKLDIFTAIGKDSVSADQLSQKLKTDSRGLATLLDALCAMALLEKSSGSYTNTKAALTFLSKDAPGYIGFMIQHHYHLVESWHRMDEAVVSGKPVRERSSVSNEEWRESFLMGMFNIAMATAPELSETLDLSGCTHLLDLGGGPGTFAIHFCLANPELKASVYDLATTRPFAEKTIQRFNVADRVNFTPGNYVLDDTIAHQEFDAAWISHILHGEGPDTAGEIIKKAAAALKPGSKIFIHEFILSEEKTAPLFPALFSLNMLVGTDQGRSYSQEELSDMLSAAGVVNIERLAFEGPTQSGILCGITS